jgi:hypothetical protein
MTLLGVGEASGSNWTRIFCQKKGAGSHLVVTRCPVAVSPCRLPPPAERQQMQDVDVRTPDSFVVGGSDCVVRCARARTGRQAGSNFLCPLPESTLLYATGPIMSRLAALKKAKNSFPLTIIHNLANLNNKNSHTY